LKGKAMKHYYVLRNRMNGKYYGDGNDEECSSFLTYATVFNSREEARDWRLITEIDDERQLHKYAEEVVEVVINKQGKPYRIIRVVR